MSLEETYPPPDIELTIEDETNGLVYIRRWFNLHFRNGKDYPMDVIAIQKIDSKTGLGNRPMWLAWWGEEEMDTVELWRIYQRRFAVEHWNRFAKQRLHWTLPKLSTPQQCQRWSHLMPLMTWQLWLARNTVPDNPLPWQKRQLRSEMTRLSGCSGICFTFSYDWNSCSTTQTARKVRRLEKGKKKK